MSGGLDIGYGSSLSEGVEELSDLSCLSDRKIRAMLEDLASSKTSILIDSQPNEEFQKCDIVKGVNGIFYTKVGEELYGLYPFSKKLRVIGSNESGIKGISGFFKHKKDKYISGVIIKND